MSSHEKRASRKLPAMNLVTLRAFEEELASIQKEAGVRDVLKRGTKPLIEKYTHAGQKAGLVGEQVLDKLRKAPVVGKKLKHVGVSDVVEAARRALT